MHIHDDWRRLFQQVKKMTLEQFVGKMNGMHSNAWHRCYDQFCQAIDMTQPPKQKKLIAEAFKKVVTDWDNMSMVEMDLSEISEQQFIDVVKENRLLGYERMIEIVKEHCKNK